MPIRVSSTRQIESLVADLASPSAVAREAAVARLTVIGARAVERLLALATDDVAAGEARVAAWLALEAIGDARALDAALRVVAAPATDPAIAAASAGVARAFVTGPRGAAVVDQLTAVATDRARPEAARIAALRALGELDRKTIAPLLKSLATDSSAAVRAEAVERARGLRAPLPGRHSTRPHGRVEALVDFSRTIADAAGSALGDDPDALRAAIHHAGAAAEPPALLTIVERVREREGAEPAERRDRWRLVRAAAHQALADRGSRIALYDLRESVESARGRLPVEFFAPLMLLGDASCLGAIAAAHAKSTDAWTRQQLTRAFYAIAERERLTPRKAAAIWARSGATARRSGKSAGAPRSRRPKATR